MGVFFQSIVISAFVHCFLSFFFEVTQKGTKSHTERLPRTPTHTRWANEWWPEAGDRKSVV